MCECVKFAGVSPCGLGIGGEGRGNLECVTVLSLLMLVPVGWGWGWWEGGPAVYESDKLVGVSPCRLG